MTATLTKTRDTQPVGRYQPTEHDARKAAADFRLVEVGMNVIVWRDGRVERVTDRALAKLQALHSWVADF